ncbi:MAG: tetratricopeptide repeat protein [Thermodesulfobacteriota bacterium]
MPPWERWFWAALCLGLLAVLGVILFLELSPGAWFFHQPAGPGRAAPPRPLEERPEMGANAVIAQDHYNQAHELLRQGSLAEAREFLVRATQLAPGFAPAWNNLGVAQMRLGDMAQAEAAFDQARRAAPSYLPAYFNLAGLLAGQGKGQEAMAVLEEGVAAMGARPELVQRLAELGLGLGLEQRALEVLERAQDRVRLQPELAELRALLLARLGRVSQAEQVLEPWAKAGADPKGNGPRRVLARLLLHRGQPERAQALLQTNLALDPGNQADELALTSTRLTRTRHGVMVMPLSLRGQMALSQTSLALFAAPEPAAAPAGELKAGEPFMALSSRDGWSQLLIQGAAVPVWTRQRLLAMTPPAPGLWPLLNLAEAD